MPRTVLTAVLLCAAAVGATPAAQAQAPAARGPVAQAQAPAARSQLQRPAGAEDGRSAEPYVVTLAPGADPERVMRETGVTRVRFVYRDTIRGFAADLDREQVAALRARPDVVAVERDGEAVGAPVGPSVTGRW
ncbi:protease inhibitor I9 family protein [Streptomyces lavendulae]|uniref:protease inhibitor I9 family protein n=1 Tax=Streptomyces lavendulae TaxID=1914 RepID=UPI0036AFA955